LWDMGLGTTFARSMAYFRGARKGGAWSPSARPKGLPQDMLRTVSVSYWFLAAVLYGAALLGGRAYFGQLEFVTTPFRTIWQAWAIYAFGCALNIAAVAPFHCLNGMGDVGIEQSLRTLFNLLALVANVILLVSGAGIVALSVVFVARGLGARAAAWAILKRRHRWLFIDEGRVSFACLRSMWRDCVRIFVTHLGAFLILQTPGLVIARFLGPERVPDFLSLWMVVQLGMMGSMAVGQAVTPHAAAAYAAGERERLLRLHRNAARLSLFLMSLWSTGVLIWAREGMTLWVGTGHFLGYGVLGPMLVTGVLEVHHNVNANFVWSAGRWPFAPWAVAAGLLNLGLGIWWVQTAGEPGMARATCVAQLLTNNWFAVYYALRRLEVPVGQYARQVALPVVGVVACSGAVAMAVKTGFLRCLNFSGSVRGLPLTNAGALALGAPLTVLCGFALFWRFGMDAGVRRAIRFQVLRLARRGA